MLALPAQGSVMVSAPAAKKPVRNRARFSAAGMAVSLRIARAGGGTAPTHKIASRERRWRRNNENGVRNYPTRHVRELSCERDADRLCNAILRF